MSVEWHSYPETKPPSEGWYLVTMTSPSSGRLSVRTRYFDFDLQCFYYDKAGDRRVEAWAELPEPFVARRSYRTSFPQKRR